MASWFSAKISSSQCRYSTVGKWIGRQPFFEGDKMKQKLRGKRGKAILDEALRRFGVDVWWSGACMLTISGFDAVGNMVFTAELANRMVDSEAWVYRVNQSKETFDANNYARVISDASTIRSLLDPSTKKALVVRKLSEAITIPPTANNVSFIAGFNIISSAAES
ncbi:hypothetical protein EDD85DRAFT_798676 [Armillaria nabsnona]|nr:hypothetical protein EDD85DRAFT_798676 [Armillaria nabsnona]